MCCQFCSRCCAYLLGSFAKWSNYVILACGVIVTLLGLKMLVAERNTICLLVLGLGALTLFVASLGLWIAEQTSSRPCWSKLYSWSLLLLVLPQLIGALLFTHPKFIESTFSHSCDYLESGTMHSALRMSGAASKAQVCEDQTNCLSMDGCQCDCDEKCRSCYQELKLSREFVVAHAKVCSYIFAGFGAIELLAWASIQLLNRFELEELLDVSNQNKSTSERNDLLRVMKAKYRGDETSSVDDRLAAKGLLGADDDDEIYII